jgi:hypothetical protein
MPGRPSRTRSPLRLPKPSYRFFLALSAGAEPIQRCQSYAARHPARPGIGPGSDGHERPNAVLARGVSLTVRRSLFRLFPRPNRHLGRCRNTARCLYQSKLGETRTTIIASIQLSVFAVSKRPATCSPFKGNTFSDRRRALLCEQCNARCSLRSRWSSKD